MTYALDYSLTLGSAHTGLTDLRAQLVDTGGVNSGSAISTGFAEIGSGCYLWHYAAFADGFRGGVKFYRAAAPGTILAFAAINPEEVEPVWSQSPRTLTQSAAALQSIIDGSTLTLRRGDTITINITGLGNISARTKLWFTVKHSTGEADSASIVQITEAAGLVYLNGAAGTAGDGSMTVTDATAGNVTIVIKAAAADDLRAATGLCGDIQMLTAGGVTTLADYTVNIEADVTRDIA